MMSVRSNVAAAAFVSFLAVLSVSTVVQASQSAGPVPDSEIAAQRAALTAATKGAGYGPQAPRDLDALEGRNPRLFTLAPPASEMALCDIHLHKNAEHKGGDFTAYAGNGDGQGNDTGFKYTGSLTAAELAPVGTKIGASDHGELVPGDTVEIHFVHSTAQATVGPTLATCLSETVKNPELRVEAVVAVLVNDPQAADFTKLAKIETINGLNQVPNLPTTLGQPIQYAGSTTGPSYNKAGSPFQVTWSVRPRVLKVDITSLGKWLADNPFQENHAHGVRTLVIDPDLLSRITR